MKIREFNHELGRTCRVCLNQAYDLRLEPQDCRYEEYPRICRRCGEVKNIVEDISLNKKVTLLLKKSEKKEAKMYPSRMIVD